MNTAQTNIENRIDSCLLPANNIAVYSTHTCFAMNMVQCDQYFTPHLFDYPNISQIFFFVCSIIFASHHFIPLYAYRYLSTLIDLLLHIYNCRQNLSRHSLEWCAEIVRYRIDKMKSYRQDTHCICLLLSSFSS